MVEKKPNCPLLMHDLVKYSASFVGQGVLNKDSSDWVDGARPANTSIPPSFHRELTQSAVQHTYPKNMSARIKISTEENKIIYWNDLKHLVTILFIDGESPNSFPWGIVHR